MSQLNMGQMRRPSLGDVIHSLDGHRRMTAAQMERLGAVILWLAHEVRPDLRLGTFKDLEHLAAEGLRGEARERLNDPPSGEDGVCGPQPPEADPQTDSGESGP